MFKQGKRKNSRKSSKSTKTYHESFTSTTKAEVVTQTFYHHLTDSKTKIVREFDRLNPNLRESKSEPVQRPSNFVPIVARLTTVSAANREHSFNQN